MRGLFRQARCKGRPCGWLRRRSNINLLMVSPVALVVLLNPFFASGCAGNDKIALESRRASVGALPLALGDPEAQAFLAASDPPATPSEEDGQIIVQRSETGAVRMVFVGPSNNMVYQFNGWGRY